MEYGSSPEEHPADHTLMRGVPPGADFGELRQHVAAKMLEVIGLTEELRQVGGNGIDEETDFIGTLVAAQQRAIVAERGQPQGSQTLDKARIGHVAFVGCKHDTAALVDDANDGLKIRLGERELEAAALFGDLASRVHGFLPYNDNQQPL